MGQLGIIVTKIGSDLLLCWGLGCIYLPLSTKTCPWPHERMLSVWIKSTRFSVTHGTKPCLLLQGWVLPDWNKAQIRKVLIHVLTFFFLQNLVFSVYGSSNEIVDGVVTYQGVRFNSFGGEIFNRQTLSSHDQCYSLYCFQAQSTSTLANSQPRRAVSTALRSMHDSTEKE